jgi:hypothetical protein
MKRSYLFTAAFCLLGSLHAFAQIGGPVMGYVPDGGSIRAIHGIPAAGIVGGIIDVGRALSLIEVAPNQSVALATATDSGETLILIPNANGSGVQIAGVPGAAAGASRIAFSPSGTAAALWFSSNGHLQVVTGLTSSPSVRETDASFAGGDPGALAVSDDGSWAIASWGQQVYAFGPDNAVNVLPVTGAAQALCFFHSSTNVAVMTADQVVTISDIGGGAVPKVIWTKPEGLVEAAPQTAVGLAASFDNSRLTVAGNAGGLFTFDMATGQGTGADCGCAPTALAGLGGSMFRLTGANAGALRVFDAATNEIWMVPLAVEADGGQQ